MESSSSIWENVTRRILRFFSAGEVKTPLSFMFRIVLAFVAMLALVLYAPIPPETKQTLVFFGAAILVLLCIFVGFFAWFKPINLVYGEAGHRAERRMEYGTEKRAISEAELRGLPPTTDQQQIEPPE